MTTTIESTYNNGLITNSTPLFQMGQRVLYGRSQVTIVGLIYITERAARLEIDPDTIELFEGTGRDLGLSYGWHYAVDFTCHLTPEQVNDFAGKFEPVDYFVPENGLHPLRL